MHITQLNRECLLHLFSFLDKESRQSLSLVCQHLREVFLDPRLWPQLHFHSLSELKKDNFVLGTSLRYLSVCWHSSKVKVCNIEDWMKTMFQRDICSKHENLVSTFLACVCSKCPNLLSLTLSGCGHVTDDDIISILRNCTGLCSLRLENCVRITDSLLHAVITYGRALKTVQVDFCRNVTQAGLQAVQELRPSVQLSAERSAGMIPDCHPEERQQRGRTVQKGTVPPGTSATIMWHRPHAELRAAK